MTTFHFLNTFNSAWCVGTCFVPWPSKIIRKWYKAADVFLLPTQYDAFGMVITEAMASGLPVIVPKDAGAAELIHNAIDGLLIERWDSIDDIVNI